MLSEVINPQIFGEQELRAIVAAPLLVSVPSMQSANEKQKRVRTRIIESLATAAMLCVVAVVTLLVYHKS